MINKLSAPTWTIFARCYLAHVHRSGETQIWELPGNIWQTYLCSPGRSSSNYTILIILPTLPRSVVTITPATAAYVHTNAEFEVTCQYESSGTTTGVEWKFTPTGGVERALVTAQDSYTFTYVDGSPSVLTKTSPAAVDSGVYSCCFVIDPTTKSQVQQSTITVACEYWKYQKYQTRMWDQSKKYSWTKWAVEWASS